MKKYLVRFVSGAVLQAESDEPLPVSPEAWWKVHLFDFRGENGPFDTSIVLKDLGEYLINLDNVEAVKQEV
jgi:hypothetical protein